MKKLFRKLFPSKEMRAYNKMYRRHQRELVKLAKETREWDYSWLYESTIMQIRHMYEYYTKRNNVWQTDETLVLIVESLGHVLALNDELDHLWDDHPRGYIKNEDGSISSTDESIKSFSEKADREMKLYAEIYSYIGKNIMYWWD